MLIDITFVNKSFLGSLMISKSEGIPRSKTLRNIDPDQGSVPFSALTFGFLLLGQDISLIPCSNIREGRFLYNLQQQCFLMSNL